MQPLRCAVCRSLINHVSRVGRHTSAQRRPETVHNRGPPNQRGGSLRMRTKSCATRSNNYSTLTLQQRAEILRLCDQKGQWFMDCFVFICSSGWTYDYCAALYPLQTPRKVIAENSWFFCCFFCWKLLSRWFDADSVHFTVQCDEMLIKVIFVR